MKRDDDVISLDAVRQKRAAEVGLVAVKGLARRSDDGKEIVIDLFDVDVEATLSVAVALQLAAALVQLALEIRSEQEPQG